MNKAERGELRKLEKLATPGPWGYDVDIWWEESGGYPAEIHGNYLVYNDEQAGNEGHVAAIPRSDGMAQDKKDQARQDAAFIAAARTAIPALLDQLDALEEALEFYAKGEHFHYAGIDDFEPENASGEPENWLSGGAEGGEFDYEDGSIAEAVLNAKPGEGV